MNAFINELKNDHLKLLAALQDVQTLGLVKEEGRKKLLECRQLLTEHLRKEDTKLYPELNSAVNRDTAAHKVAAEYANEMKTLTKSIVDFINRAEKAEIDMEYAKELGKIISTIKMRIRREEIQLYPLYEKLAG